MITSLRLAWAEQQKHWARGDTLREGGHLQSLEVYLTKSARQSASVQI
jgi:hypothetical protein